MTNGIIIVDHGSRRAASNEMLERVAQLFAERFADRYPIVEPAHMELAEPSIASAYAKCVARGAQRVIVAPFFLGPGKHWTQDIPALTAAAAEPFPETRYHVSMTLGIDNLILDLMEKRVSFCVNHEYRCEACTGSVRCDWREGGVRPVAREEAAHETGGTNTTLCGSCPFRGKEHEQPKQVTAV